MKCRRRNLTCRKIYEESKSRADWKGYCSQKCLHAMAKRLGFRPSVARRLTCRTEYGYLKRVGQVGSVPVTKEEEIEEAIRNSGIPLEDYLIEVRMNLLKG